MNTRREIGENAALARTETLLHQAADFVPAESAPEGLAQRALTRWEAADRDCSPRLKRNFAPAIGLALAGAALFCLLPRFGTDRLPLSSEQAAWNPSPTPDTLHPTPFFSSSEQAAWNPAPSPFGPMQLMAPAFASQLPGAHPGL